MFVAATSRGEAIRRLRDELSASGIPDATLEARALAKAALGLGAAGLLAGADGPLGPDGATRLAALARRRLAREPLGRILGTREFWSLTFRLSPGTLEPRPDTETVVSAALRRVPDRSAALRILDLGTGSGCILVALLAELPAAFGIGTDRSEDALRTARANAAAAGVGGRAGFAASDWGAALAGPFDLVVANPPYIASATLPGLAPEVLAHDPRAALDGGPDGLDAYRAILPDLPRLLAAEGWAVLEIGHDQACPLTRLAGEAGFDREAVERDLGGRDRTVVLRTGR